MILTIDVGLKNLAMCIMNASDPKDIQTYAIHLWDVYNTLEDDTFFCTGTLKKGTVCGKKAGCKVQGQHYCKTHAPKGLQVTQVRPKRVDEYLLQEIATVVLAKLNEIISCHSTLFDKLRVVHIELQPKVNNKMKLVSHIIYGKLVETFIGKNVNVRFVRASQKLKAYKGPVVTCKLKGAYAKRKYLSIEYTKWFLAHSLHSTQYTSWYSKFMGNTKRDDLGDVFLMAINAVKQYRI